MFTLFTFQTSLHFSAQPQWQLWLKSGSTVHNYFYFENVWTFIWYGFSTHFKQPFNFFKINCVTSWTDHSVLTGNCNCKSFLTWRIGYTVINSRSELSTIEFCWLLLWTITIPHKLGSYRSKAGQKCTFSNSAARLLLGYQTWLFRQFHRKDSMSKLTGLMFSLTRPLDLFSQ